PDLRLRQRHRRADQGRAGAQGPGGVPLHRPAQGRGGPPGGVKNMPVILSAAKDLGGGAVTAPAVPPFDLDRVRSDFPVLAREVHGHPLVYLDSAASAQKPRPVIEAIATCLTGHYANIHRGVHTLSQEATALYEGARVRVARFLNAPAVDEVVF